MKIAIIFASVHHGNTRKVVEQIAQNNDVDLIDATQVKEKDLSEYDRIGFASGIYYGKFHKSVLNFGSFNQQENKEVVLICTHVGSSAYQSIETIIKDKHCNVIGKFSCKGYDTFGPFKLVGGIAKGHPNEKDLTAAMEFYQSL